MQSFFDIVDGDGEFDKAELVIILNSISFSSTYLADMFGDLQSFIFVEGGRGTAEDVSDGVMGRVRMFSAVCSSSKSLADKYSEDFVRIFCQGEGCLMDRFIAADNIYDECDEEGCLLGHLNGLLGFFDERLKLATDKATAKFNRLIQQTLFRSLDDKMGVHHRVLSGMARDEVHRDKARSACAAIGEIIKFKAAMGLEEEGEDGEGREGKPKLEEIANSLWLQSVDTRTLIAKHQSEVREAMGRERQDEMGELSFQAGFLERGRALPEGQSELLVVLWSLRGVRMRWGKQQANPSVTARLVPGEAGRKGVTAVHEDSINVLFDLAVSVCGHGGELGEDVLTEDSGCVAGNGGHVFSFDVGDEEDLHDVWLSLELFDHSGMKTHKVGRRYIFASY